MTLVWVENSAFFSFFSNNNFFFLCLSCSRRCITYMSYKYKYDKLVKLDKVFFNNFLRFFVEWWQVLWYWHLTIIESLYSLSVVLIWLYLTESGLVFFPYSMMMTIQEQQRKKKERKNVPPMLIYTRLRAINRREDEEEK